MNFCDQCGRFRNPKKCEEELLGSLVLCECEEEEDDENDEEEEEEEEEEDGG